MGLSCENQSELAGRLGRHEYVARSPHPNTRSIATDTPSFEVRRDLHAPSVPVSCSGGALTLRFSPEPCTACRFLMQPGA